jgi:hypothetical protein
MAARISVAGKWKELSSRPQKTTTAEDKIPCKDAAE